MCVLPTNRMSLTIDANNHGADLAVLCVSRASAPSDLKFRNPVGMPAHRADAFIHDTLPPFSTTTHIHIARRRSSPRRSRLRRGSDGALARAACYGGAHVDRAQLPRLPLPPGVRFVRHSNPFLPPRILCPENFPHLFLNRLGFRCFAAAGCG